MYFYLLTTGKAEALHQVPVCQGPVDPSHLWLSRQVPDGEPALLWKLRPIHSATVWEPAWSSTDSGRGVCVGDAALISQLHTVPGRPREREGGALWTPLEADAQAVPPLPHTVRPPVSKAVAVCSCLFIWKGLLTWREIRYTQIARFSSHKFFKQLRIRLVV